MATNCLPAEEFDPHDVDTDGWVEAVAAMGAKIAVFVVRHGCGFDLFPTNASLSSGIEYNYSIKNAAYKEGQQTQITSLLIQPRDPFKPTRLIFLFFFHSPQAVSRSLM